MRGGIRIHRSKHAEIISKLCRVREQTADLETALAVLVKLERRSHQMSDGTHIRAYCEITLVRFPVMPSKIGLGVKSVHLTWSAIHEKEDNVFGLGSKVWRLCSKWICSSAGWRCSRVLCEKPSRLSRSTTASSGNPAPTLRRNWRRSLFMMISIRVGELVHIEDDAT